MADEDVIAGTGEPAAVEEPTAPAEPVEPQGDDQPLATDDGAPSDDDGAQEPAAETEPESLEAVLDRYPTLREHYDAKLKERENAGGQRREAQLKREAGKKGQTKANVQRFLSEAGVEVEDTARLDYFYDLAAANAAYELATTLPDVVLSKYQVPAEARERAVELREAGDWDGYLTTLVDAAATRKVEELRADEQRRIKAEVDRRLAAEIKARGIEKAPVREGAPVRPSAGQTGPAGPSLEEYRTATASQRAEWRRKGVNPVLAQ